MENNERPSVKRSYKQYLHSECLDNMCSKKKQRMIRKHFTGLDGKQFDVRPGLKFLTQKVGNLNKSANLYTQANTSEVVQIIVLIELCLDGIGKYSIRPKDLREILDNGPKSKCWTDLDYVEQFLKKLQIKWDYLCESYINLTINIPENVGHESDEDLGNYNEDHSQKVKPNDSKKDDDSFSCSTDSESYLEREVLPNIRDEDEPKTDEATAIREKSSKLKSSMSLDENLLKSQHKQEVASTDDETNESAAKYKKQIYDKYKTDLNSIKYDANTLLQMRNSTISSDNIVSSCGDKFPSAVPLPRINPFMSSSMIPPPQTIPPEIQQQRAMSIFRDSEAYKITRIETMEACLELLSSLSSEKLSPLAPVLKQGAILLVAAQDEKIKIAAEGLLDKMNISYIDHDSF